MVGDRDNKKRNLKGKNPYRDLREFKSKEIKKSLTHRARLRKNYFKLLEKEGEPTEFSKTNIDDVDNVDKNKSKAIQEKKPLNFAERTKIAKERKEQNRKAKLEAITERRKTIESKAKARDIKKERMSQKTKFGQPLMGPRINNLLEKIKKDIQ